MKKERFREPQLFYSHNTSNSKQTTFSSSGITTTTSTGASSNPMATKEVGTGPGVLINNQSDTPIMKSVGTGDEARQNNHSPGRQLVANFPFPLQKQKGTMSTKHSSLEDVFKITPLPLDTANANHKSQICGQL